MFVVLNSAAMDHFHIYGNFYMADHDLNISTLTSGRI